MMIRLIATMLAASWTSTAHGQIIDPAKLLKSFDDRAYERKGSLFWNLESEDDWAKRLSVAPLRLERVFVRWKPTEQRESDVAVVICFDRRLQVIERTNRHLERSITASISFANGTSVNSEIDLLLSAIELDGLLRDRCVTVREGRWHPAMRRQDAVHVAHEKRFRAENITKVAVKIQRSTKYGPVVEEEGETTEITSYIEPHRKIFKSPHSHPEVVPTTVEFVRGRIWGEALYYARKCPELSLQPSYDPPSESDTSEYAQGFAQGWDIAERFTQRQSKLCSVVADILEIKQSGIASPLPR